MLLFCPHCSSILRIHQSHTSTADFTPSQQNSWRCPSCTYTCPVRSQRPFAEISQHTRKEVEDVIGGAAALENAQKTDIKCPREGCDGVEAVFTQKQIRSADEPMTMFYTCTTCMKDWMEG